MRGRLQLFSLVFGWVVAASAGELRPIEGPPVDVPALLQRVVDRARAIAADTNTPTFVFRKLAVQDTLAADGTVKSTKEKVYEVTLAHGMTQNRLVAVNGRRLDEVESGALSEKERRWRDTYANKRGDAEGRTERMDQVIDAKLFARFDFTVAGREIVRGRPSLVLDFKPRAGDLPDDRLVDRVLNLFKGRIWIDEQEDELVRAEAATDGPLRVWGGVLGSLERFQLHVDRERSAYGVWFNRHAEITVKARKLLTTFGMRLREVGSDLRPAT